MRRRARMRCGTGTPDDEASQDVTATMARATDDAPTSLGTATRGGVTMSTTNATRRTPIAAAAHPRRTRSTAVETDQAATGNRALTRPSRSTDGRAATREPLGAVQPERRDSPEHAPRRRGVAIGLNSDIM